MIVPDYWAEARKQHREPGKQVTVRRLGWSTLSQADALEMTEARATEALARILSGEKLDRRERKTPYNGASGVPIREEVLSRHGDEVITRNSYGAHCLNTPHALFADIDFDSGGHCRTTLALIILLAVLSIFAGFHFHNWGLPFAVFVFFLLLVDPLASFIHRAARAIRGGSERIARRRIDRFLATRPAWNLRLYRTPGGMRLLATHQAFEPSAPEVQEFFSAVGTDPVYVRMCLNQQCFRARLTAKPWRIGISSHMRPRPGVWPVDPSRLHLRNEWIARYEQVATGFAACHFLEAIGSGTVHDSIRSVIDLHDRESKSQHRDLPIA
ncbi:hypothetical protein OJ996_25845 [Luteolibacter sp. GHJ8]|uniref:Transmembrane protein n=1 Tax=Luteolibacter rhizosphaerae TaxID=2989719 RepID=A0ABT3GC48_9BACT|nr:hypothetical protein [Luteolibacter rhizosphaerae]MCW1917039.1 hypothetical protein [Luteolibacter rhizosphaerae]